MVLEFGQEIFVPLGQAGADAFDDTARWVDPNHRRFSDRLWRAKHSDRAAIDRILREAIVSGDDPLLAAERLERYLTPAGQRVTTELPRPASGRDEATGNYAARRLARTEVTRAFGQATIQAAELNPFVVGVKWNLSARHPKSDPCDENARRSSRGMDRGVYLTREAPRYPEHPQCFPDGTKVMTADGERPIESVVVGDCVLTHEGRYRPVVACHARLYGGEMVIVDLKERLLFVTPEHPLLTERGWVEAACLQPGDHLCRAGVGIRHDAFVGEVQNLPTRLMQFLVSRGIGGGIGVPLHAITLNDQSGGGDYKVGPAATNTMPVLGEDARAKQRVLHDSLDLASSVRLGHTVVDMARGIGRMLGALRRTHLGPYVWSLGGVVGNSSGADLGAHFWPFRWVVFATEIESGHSVPQFRRFIRSSLRSPRWPHRFADRAHGHAEPLAQATKHAERDAPLRGKAMASDAIGKITLSQKRLERLTEDRLDTGDVAVLSADHLEVRHLGIIADFRGMLRNLEVSEDHTFAVNGVVAHNCLCYLSPVTVEDTDAALAQLRRDFDLDPTAAPDVPGAAQRRASVLTLFRAAAQSFRALRAVLEAAA